MDKSSVVVFVTLALFASLPQTAVANGSYQPMLCALEHGHFTYDHDSSIGPEHWGEISPCCDGKRQSPRDLLTNPWVTNCNVAGLSSSFIYSPTTVTGSLYNNGHTAVIDFAAGSTSTLTGAPHAHSPYVLANVHIHFNTLQGRGSEHAIDGKHFDAEVHIVHFKQSYGDVGTAVTHEDGLLVIGVMLTSTQSSGGDAEIINLIDSIVSLKGVGKEHAIPITVNLHNLIPTSRHVLTYAGSLTTPPCSESVRWIVFQDPLEIHDQELQILVNLENEDGGLISEHSNDRPLQDCNSQVETNFYCHGHLG